MSARRNGNRARCTYEGCEKFAQTRGLCKAHGGGSRCRDVTCNKLAQSRGLCIAHGGGRRCQHEGCAKLAQSKGFCISHGGGRRCTVPNCEKFSQVKGRCKSHSKMAESSDQDVEDDEETDVEPMAEPMSDRTESPPRHDYEHQAQGYAHVHKRLYSPPSFPSDNKSRVDFLVNPMARLQQQHRVHNDSIHLPPPHTLGLNTPHQPLLPPRPVVMTVDNQEREMHTSDFGDGVDDVARRATVYRSEDPFKRVPSINPRFQEEELRPLPYLYQLPSSNSIFGSVEEKRESDDALQAYPLLPSRFMQPRPSQRPLPSISAVQGHFSTHSHPEPAIEPTSIPLLSFLDRSDRSNSDPPHHTPWNSSSSTATASSSSVSSGGAAGTTTTVLPSIVLPPLMRSNQSQR